MNPHNFIDDVRNRIAKGQLALALKNLTAFLKEKKLFYNEIISLSGRYADLKNEQNAGHLLPQEYKAQQAQIRSALLELLDKVEKKTVKPDETKTTDDPKLNLAWVKFVGIGIAILAIGYVVSQNIGGNHQNPAAKVDTVKTVDSTLLIDPKLGRVVNVDFPRLESIGVKAGDRVLVPIPDQLEKHAHSPKARFSLTYSAAVVVKPGKYESVVKTNNKTANIPNAWVIPLTAQPPKIGDIFFSRNLAGRFVVTGNRTHKRKIPIGISLSGTNPNHKWIAQPTPLHISSDWFLIAKDGFYPGSAVAFGTNKTYQSGIIIRQIDNKILVQTFSAGVVALPKASCHVAPLNPRLKIGEHIQVPKDGTYYAGQITRINAKLRHVYVKRVNASEEVYFIGTVFRKRDLE